MEDGNAALKLSLDLEFEGQPFRIYGTPERPLWIAGDVCLILGIKKSRDALARFDGDEKDAVIVGTLGGPQEVLAVTEPGLYRLISKSRKSVARRFQRWVHHDILPSIREHGCYPAPDKPILRMGGEAIVRFDEGKLATAISTGIAPLLGAHAQLTEQVGLVVVKVDALDERVARIERRRDVPEATRRKHLHALRYYSGVCPCCGRVHILDDQGNPVPSLEWDHIRSPADVHVDEVWPVCRECNARRSRDRDFRDRTNAAEVVAWRRRRREYEANFAPLLPGVA